MPADIRTIERRISALEQAAETQHRQTTGIPYADLRGDESMALLHHLTPAKDGERVRKILRGELHVIYPPNYSRGLENLSLEELKAKAHDLRRRREESCGCTLTEERQRLLATGTYRELEADPHA